MLVALLVLSIGLLGVAALQMNASAEQPGRAPALASLRCSRMTSPIACAPIATWRSPVATSCSMRDTPAGTALAMSSICSNGKQRLPTRCRLVTGEIALVGNMLRIKVRWTDTLGTQSLRHADADLRRHG